MTNGWLDRSRSNTRVSDPDAAAPPRIAIPILACAAKVECSFVVSNLSIAEFHHSEGRVHNVFLFRYFGQSESDLNFIFVIFF